MQSVSTASLNHESIATLQSLLSHTSSNANFLLFLSLVRKLDYAPEQVEFQPVEIATEMVLLAWFASRVSRVNLGDNEPAVKTSKLAIPDSVYLSLRSADALSEARAHVLHAFDQGIVSIDTLLRFAPYRLIKPFFLQETGGLAESTSQSVVDKLIAELSMVLFDIRKPLYRVSPLDGVITIHPLWQNYLCSNNQKLTDWALNQWSESLRPMNASPPSHSLLFPGNIRKPIRSDKDPATRFLAKLDVVADRSPLRPAPVLSIDAKAASQISAEENKLVSLDQLTVPQCLDFSMCPNLEQTLNQIRDYLSDMPDPSFKQAIAAIVINAKGLADKEAIIQEALTFLLKLMPLEDLAPNPVKDTDTSVAGVTELRANDPAKISADGSAKALRPQHQAETGLRPNPLAAVSPTPLAETPAPPTPVARITPLQEPATPIKVVPTSPSTTVPTATTPQIPAHTGTQKDMHEVEALMRPVIAYLQQRDGQASFIAMREDFSRSNSTRISFDNLQAVLSQLRARQMIIKLSNPDRYRLTRIGWKYRHQAETGLRPNPLAAVSPTPPTAVTPAPPTPVAGITPLQEPATPIKAVPASASTTVPPATATQIPAHTGPQQNVHEVEAFMRPVINYLQQKDGQASFITMREDFGRSNSTRISFDNLQAVLLQLQARQMIIKLSNPDRYRLTPIGWNYGKKPLWLESQYIATTPVATKPPQSSSPKDSVADRFMQIFTKHDA